MSDDSRPNAVTPPPRPIAGFWRRLAAMLVDGLLLGGVGLVLGAVFSDRFQNIGQWGRGLGLVVALLYFAVANSSLASGQTLGKRWLGVRVVGGDGRPISVGRSLARAVILDTPFFLNGMLLPAWLDSWPAHLAAALVVFGGGFGIVYFYVCNRATRQSLHDLLCGTYVVRRDWSGPLPRARVAPLYYAVFTAGIVGLIAVLWFGLPRFLGPATVAELSAVQRRLAQDPEALHVSVLKTWGSGSGRHGLTVQVWRRGAPGSSDAEADRIAAVVLESYPRIEDVETLTVVITRGYDIGIASFNRSVSTPLSPAKWKERVAQRRA